MIDNEWEFKRYSYLEGNSEDPSNMRTVSFKTFNCKLDPVSKVQCCECDWYSSASIRLVYQPLVKALVPSTFTKRCEYTVMSTLLITVGRYTSTERC